MGVCQWIIVVFWVLKLILHLCKHGEDMHLDFDFGRACGDVAVSFILLYFGGFF